MDPDSQSHDEDLLLSTTKNCAGAKPITFDDLAKVAKKLSDKAQAHHNDAWRDHFLRQALRPGQLFPRPDAELPKPEFPFSGLKHTIRWKSSFPIDFRHIVTAPTIKTFKEAMRRPALYDCDTADLKKVMKFMFAQNISMGWHYDPEKPKNRGWVNHVELKHLRVIHLNPFSADIFTVLHEIGHVLCGPCCCSGHEEWTVYEFVVKMHVHLELETPIPDSLRTYRDTFLLERMMCERGMRIE